MRPRIVPTMAFPLSSIIYLYILNARQEVPTSVTVYGGRIVYIQHEGKA